jgi:hypothetical protein
MAPATKVKIAIGCLELMTAPLIGCGALVAFIGMTKTVENRDIALYLGWMSLILLGLIQTIAFGLFKGQMWARPAGIAISLLALPSLALPIAFVGLRMLLDGESYKAYGWQRKGVKRTSVRLPVKKRRQLHREQPVNDVG